MWDFFHNLPFLYPSLGRNNLNTLPSVNVSAGTENVTIEIPNHAFFRRNYVGSFFLDLRTAIPAGTAATLPVLIGTNGDTRRRLNPRAFLPRWRTSPVQASMRFITTGTRTSFTW